MSKKQSTPKVTPFQIHEHSLVSGARANIEGPHRLLRHSHAGGEQPHQHPHYGPAFYGHLYQRDTFSAKPLGDQLQWQELEEWQKSFEIIICDPPKDYIGEGPGTLPAERMVRGFKMRISQIVDRTSGGAA